MLLELAVERGHGTVGKGVMAQWGKGSWYSGESG